MPDKFGTILAKYLWDPFLSAAGTFWALSFSLKYRIFLFYFRKNFAYCKTCFARDSDRDRAKVSSFVSRVFLLWWMMNAQHTFMDLILLIPLIHTHKYCFSSEQFVLLHIVIIYLCTSCQMVHRQKCLIAHNRLFSEILFSSTSYFTLKIEPCAPVLCVFFFFLFKWKIMPERKSYQNIFYRWIL